MRAPQIVFGLMTLTNAAAGIVGALAALLALAPLLVPLALLALVPAALVTRTSGDAYYRFAFGQTARDRERSYLAHVLATRETAAELRAFELAGFLRARHDRLADERVAGLRVVVRRQLRLALAGDLVTALVIGGTVIGLGSLAGDSLGIAGAAAAAGAILLFGQRAAHAGLSAGMLYESALFLEDFAAFAEVRPWTPPEGAAGGRIEVRDVCFTYRSGDRPALRGVS